MPPHSFTPNPPESLPSETGETKDGTGAGDHDSSFTWGTPRTYLTLMVQARLQILRGYVLDAKRGEPGGAADGDIDWLVTTDSEALVPESPTAKPVKKTTKAIAKIPPTEKPIEDEQHDG